MIKTGYCSCNDPVLLFAAEFFVNGIIEAGKVITCGFLKAIDLVMAIGMIAIPPPGKAITGGMGEYSDIF